jgi:membrane fusion protein (multidrug efflux system)
MRARFLLALMALAACNKTSAEPATRADVQRPPEKVETAKVEARPMPKKLVLTGSLTPNKTSDLAANAAGKVVEVKVDRGSLVENGQILVRLDARSAALSSEEATANLKVAEEQQRQAQIECARSKKLLDTGAISQAEYDRTSSQCTTSTSSAAAAAARLDMAQKSLSDSYIRAPFAGLIAERYVEVGEYVLAQTKVATLLQIDPLRIELNVPEEDVPLVKLEQKVDFSVSSYADQTFTGTVAYMGPALRGNSRDLLVDALVQNGDHRLRPGMFATARLDLGMVPVAVIPKAAVRDDGTVHHVFAVTDGPQGKQVEDRIAQLGEEAGDSVAVLDGVKTGETVVLHPSDTLSDGARVE